MQVVGKVQPSFTKGSHRRFVFTPKPALCPTVDFTAREKISIRKESAMFKQRRIARVRG